MFEILEVYLAEFTYAGIFFVLLLCGMGLPVPEDIPILISGYLSHLGTINIWAALGVNFAGILIGDLTIYAVGYWMGPRAREIPLLHPIVSRGRMAKVERFFGRHGRKAIFFGRFVAGLRAPLFLAAGMTRLPLRTFLGMDLAAALISVPLLTFLAFFFGDEFDALRSAVGTTKLLTTGLAALLAAWFAGRYLIRRWRATRMDLSG